MNDERSTESIDKAVTRNVYASKNQYSVFRFVFRRQINKRKKKKNSDRRQKALSPALKA